MKKSLFILATAAIALASCNNDVKIAENKTLGNQPQEIAFFPLAEKTARMQAPAARAQAVDGTAFPTTMGMTVAAFDVTNKREFFEETAFSYVGSKTYPDEAVAKNYWTGGKYWPLSPTYINFLAYADFQGSTTVLNWGADAVVEPATPAVNPTLALTMTDNHDAQKDLMYAWGYGEVTQPTTNTLMFPKYVAMEFKHAQAWISFNAKAKESAESNLITLKSITLIGAKYNGVYTVTFTNGRNNASQSVAGAWSALGAAQDVVVPGWDTPTAIAYAATGDGQAVGNGLMIVPDGTASGDFTKFVIEYVLDSKTYTYEYTPASTDVAQGNHYIYNIVFDLHEIEITPTITDWSDQTPVSVPIF